MIRCFAIAKGADDKNDHVFTIVAIKKQYVRTFINHSKANEISVTAQKFNQLWNEYKKDPAKNIKLIQRRIGLDRLPTPLKQVADLRIQNPDISLKELGELLEPPIGKSGINHRMRKLENISDELKG